MAASELSPSDKQALNHVEQEAATGHGADALKDLKAWRNSADDIGKYRLAAKELEQRGFLPVLGAAQLADKVATTGKSIDETRIADLADSNDPIDRAIWGAARDNLKGVYHAPSSWSSGTYEDANNLKSLQARIERGRPALAMADELTSDNNALFKKLSKDGVLNTQTVKDFLLNQDGSAAERTLARKLLTQLASGSGEAIELTPDGGADAGITAASLKDYKLLHPDAPPSLQQ